MKIIGSRFRIRGGRRFQLQQKPEGLGGLASPLSPSTPALGTPLEEKEFVPAPPQKKFKRKALLIGVQQVRMGEVDGLTPVTATPFSPNAGNVLSPTTPRRAKRRVRKKAAVEPKALKGPHRDVEAMKELLVDLYKYDPEDITVLIDDDDPAHIQPTADNILEAIDLLIMGAQEGDRFFFHFSGHSTQEDTDDIEEEDGKNEFIMTSDGQTISDNILRARLVKPLPPKSSLIAVFDSCHSGTLLDLKHFRCNQVYVPWLNKGERRTNSLWYNNQRKPAKISTRAVQQITRLNAEVVRWTQTSIDQLLMSPDEAKGYDVKCTPVVQKRRTSLSVITDLSSFTSEPERIVEEPATFDIGEEEGEEEKGKQKDSAHEHHVPHPTKRRSSLFGSKRNSWRQSTFLPTAQPLDVAPPSWLGSPIQRCSSPEMLYCSGDCRTNPMWKQEVEKDGEGEEGQADVISLSSAADAQRSWESADGTSMTMALVRILKEDPHPTFSSLLTLVSHDLHAFYLVLHLKAREYRKRVQAINAERAKKGKKPKRGDSVEMNNFQNPQLSSDRPLDMSRSWYP